MQPDLTVKQRLMEVATDLLQETGGNPGAITARAIAERAGVSVGLMNYHFQSKEHLLRLCVQRLIQQVVEGFVPPGGGHGEDGQRLAAWANAVWDFLQAHPGASRYSILDDLQQDSPASNTVRTQRGFARALTQGDGQRQALVAFALTSALQMAFLCPNTAREALGVDLTQPEARVAWVASLAALLCGGAGEA